MPVYNSQEAVLTLFRTEWINLLQTVKNFALKDMSIETQSNGAFEDYFFLGTVGGIKEWIDKLGADNIEDYQVRVHNKPFGDVVLADRFTLRNSERTLGGALKNGLETAFQNWIKFPDGKLNELLVANPLAFDKTAFFSDTRPNLKTSGAVDNIVSGTGVALLSTIEADLKSAISQMRAMKDKNGNPLNAGAKFMALIPSHLEHLFDTLKNSDNIIEGGVTKSNSMKGKFDYIINDYQSVSVNDWYVINTAAPQKPFLVQSVDTPTWDMEDIKDERFIKYITSAQKGFALFNPLAIVKVDN